MYCSWNCMLHLGNCSAKTSQGWKPMIVPVLLCNRISAWDSCSYYWAESSHGVKTQLNNSYSYNSYLRVKQQCYSCLEEWREHCGHRDDAWTALAWGYPPFTKTPGVTDRVTDHVSCLQLTDTMLPANWTVIQSKKYNFAFSGVICWKVIIAVC